MPTDGIGQSPPLAIETQQGRKLSLASAICAAGGITMATILLCLLLNRVTSGTVGARLFLVLMLIWLVAQSTAASAQDERSRRCREELEDVWGRSARSAR